MFKAQGVKTTRNCPQDSTYLELTFWVKLYQPYVLYSNLLISCIKYQEGKTVLFPELQVVGFHPFKSSCTRSHQGTPVRLWPTSTVLWGENVLVPLWPSSHPTWDLVEERKLVMLRATVAATYSPLKALCKLCQLCTHKSTFFQLPHVSLKFILQFLDLPHSIYSFKNFTLIIWLTIIVTDISRIQA